MRRLFYSTIFALSIGSIFNGCRSDIEPSSMDEDKIEVSVTPPPENTSDTRSKIIIIIDDAGRDTALTRAFGAIDTNITLSFLPYVDKLREQILHAYKNGNEIMAHIPMKATSPVWDSEKDLLSNDDPLLIDKFKKILDRYPEVISGLNNHLGSAFTSDPQAMSKIMRHVAQRENSLYFIDSKTSPLTVGEPFAKFAGVQSETNDLFIDNEQSVEYTLSVLNKLQSIAKENGHVIAIGHPHHSTLIALDSFVNHHIDYDEFELSKPSEVVTYCPVN